MKLKKATYLSLTLLICFLTSTTLGITFSYYSSLKSAADYASRHQSVSSDDADQNISNGLNFVKTESENENDIEDAFNVQEFILPFVFAFLPSEEIHMAPDMVSHEVSVSETNPIYIAIRNFRI